MSSLRSPGQFVIPEDAHCIIIDDDYPSEATMDLTTDDQGTDFLEQILLNDIDEEDVVLLSGLQEVTSAVHNGLTLNATMTVEMSDGDFLRICQVLRDFSTSGEIYLRGYLVRRTRLVDNMLRKTRNELCIVRTAVQNNQNRTDSSGDLTIPVSRVICVRNVIYTNRPYPAFSSNICYPARRPTDTDTGVLVCRYIQVKQATQAGRKLETFAEELRFLNADECDIDRGQSDSIRLRAFLSIRQDKQRTRPVDVDLTIDPLPVYSPNRSLLNDNITIGNSRSNRRQRHRLRTPASLPSRYSYGEICAGAGGVSMAAKMANLRIRLLLDQCPKACATLRRNFPATAVVQASIYGFCMDDYRFMASHVDLLWISYPCQYFSPAHTRPGRNDEKNMSAMFSIQPLVDRIRPRIIMFEQTSGIKTHKPEFLDALVHSLVDQGYSIRMGILNASNFGNVQSRRRLFMFAAAPGQILPDLPRPTHGPGLIPYATMADVLAQVPSTNEPHMRECGVGSGQAYNARMRSRIGTITTGGALSHPNGQRSLTIQELAIAAGFLPTHRFAAATKTALRIQIGNAVSYVMAKAMIDEAVKALIKSDAALRTPEPSVEIIL